MINSEAFDVLMGEPDDRDAEIEGLQQLVDSGQAWLLEGSVGRACADAIEDGVVTLGAVGHRDYWGSYVPSRTEVEPGTKGSIEYAHRVGGDEQGHEGEQATCARCAAMAARGRSDETPFTNPA